MKNLLLTLALLPLTGCATIAGWLAPDHTIDAQAAGPLILGVCDQHDELVQRDTVLVEGEKTQALRSSAILRTLVEEANK